ncbi:VOC family protein [Catenuloplanes atrovinosus]|uniref:Catechol 2,3-dioxygenase-like lactoylglutathione lyase family enzyme n=1 Tax=Catenuloplanes atrovinosus TaxID=137266 RepID=A0AAE4C9T8_9ACTN|nr:VOC family protein [Catenuloplanes atrovinosus]MDR7276896.1 catechol 2,3-dioxygenase-like lactoylglutathione lyase family enzyme [Catenuloplanes atrovinosus]
MGVDHLGLPVREPRRSIEFYAAYFGFDPATARRYPDGTVIVRDGGGFDLALHPVETVAPAPAFLHFGFRQPDPDGVRALLRRMDGDGVPVVEREDGPDYTAFKCLDPDGHRVEVYWEP